MLRIDGAGGDGGRPDLAAVVCPCCGGRLIWWGWDRPRLVRAGFDRFGACELVRRRRVMCRGCGRTHVVRDSRMVPRHRDGARVVVAALRARAAGFGLRAAAEVVDRAFSTVRNWFRAAKALEPWAAELWSGAV
ncbi:MAG: hypothetical protein LBE08_03690 [Bifidobacteriaceae bacterium]|nr:hypothetical protein [Bifidobacteriaceae bacterium]